MEILYKFGSVVRQFRLLRGMSQEQLADRSGLHRTYISSIERGVRNVSLVNIQKIADALGISLSEIFAEIENGEENNVYQNRGFN